MRALVVPATRGFACAAAPISRQAGVGTGLPRVGATVQRGSASTAAHLLRKAKLAVLGGVFLLAAGCCGYTNTQWITAPLVADVVYDGSGISAYDDSLAVDAAHTAYMRFSLATLPGVGAPTSGVKGQCDANGQNCFHPLADSGYALTAAKIVRARLVLFAEQVTTPGQIVVASPAVDCWPREYAAPAATNPCNGGAAAYQPGVDADNPGAAQALSIADAGFYAVDVTAAVKNWVQNGANQGVLAFRAAGSGSFRFVSKDAQRSGATLAYNARLLVTVSDSIGTVRNVTTATSVREDQPAATGSTLPDLRLNAVAGKRAYALLNANMPPAAPILLYQLLNVDHAKVSLSTYASGAVTDASGGAPRIDLYQTPSFDASNSAWSNWSVPTATPFASTSLDANLAARNQVLISDISLATLTKFLDAYNAQVAAQVSYVTTDNPIALGTDRVQPVLLDSLARGSQHPPQLILATGFPRGLSTGYLDTNDQRPRLWCVQFQYSSDQQHCGSVPLLRAHVGQKFEAMRIQMAMQDRGNLDGIYQDYLAIPMHVAAPATGATAALDRSGFDLDALNPYQVQQRYSWYSAAGYAVVATANMQPGSYSLSASAVGHNGRLAIPMENVAAPVPVLSGPTSLRLPIGAISVTVPANADAPFALSVDDHGANLIDEATRWAVSSSMAADTPPGVISQSDGSTNFALTFASAGPRTITATSRGDATIKTSLDVTVVAQTRTTLAAQGTIPVFGQPFVVSATVTDNAGAAVAGASVQFYSGSKLLGSAATGTDGSAKATLTDLAAGVYAITAKYAGNVATYLDSSMSEPGTYAVDAAATIVTLSAPATATFGQPISVGATVAPVAPGAGQPTGTMTIGDGEVSCRYDLPAANGCTLASIGAGSKTLTATYSGDANFIGSSVVSALSVGKQAQTLTFPAQSVSSRPFVASAIFSIYPPAASAAPNSGSAIVYSSLSPSVCTVAGTTVTMLGVGTCSIAADQAGNDNYAKAQTAIQDIGIGRAASTTTLTASSASGVYGRSATFTVTVAPAPGNPLPTGSVDFTDETLGASLCTAVALSSASGWATATCTTDALGAGSHLIRASYRGDDTTAGSNNAFVYTVVAAGTSMTLVATPNPALVGRTVTLTAAVSVSASAGGGDAVAKSGVVASLVVPDGSSPANAANQGILKRAANAEAQAVSAPSGTVTFYDGDTQIGAVALDAAGTAALSLSTLTPGTHNLSAIYSGNGAYVQAAAQVTLAVNVPPVPAPAVSAWMLVLLGVVLIAAACSHAARSASRLAVWPP
ncbi:MAG: Ig-like domain repeat protein [Rudaea sp.]|nr:Ig-like domain repeat protein [Rudaea sp.]